jgi:hypothetical protein
MANYQKLGKQNIAPLMLQGNAFDVAQSNYAKYSGLDFGTDLLHYLREGFVVSRPTAFAMGKPIELNGKRGWFIQIAVGNIMELILCLPFRLDFVAFCRNNDDNLRVIDFDKYVKRVAKMYGYKDAGTN